MNMYDEDLTENAFYCNLQTCCPQLYATAAENRWMICVPRSSVVSRYLYAEPDFENHILIPVHDEPNKFTTASNKHVTIQDNVISTASGFSELRKVPILFEETFFNKNDESFHVLCISVPLEGGPADLADDTPVVTIKNLEDCKDMLWGHTGNLRTQKYLHEIMALFNSSCNRLEGQNMRHHVDAANALFTKAMQTVLKDSHLKNMARHNKAYMDTLKIAVETYVMHHVYVRLFKCISGCLASKDAMLNKVTRNLAELQLRDLGVRQEFCHNVPRARREMSNLNRYSTPIGKLNCIKRVVDTIMTPHKAAAKDESSSILTTDDLLPILVFLVVKSEIPNWWANLTYMTSFRFSKSSNDDEYGFFLASMEAAIEHVSAGQLNKLKLGAENPEKMQLSISPNQHSDGMWMRQDSAESSSIDRFFQSVKDNEMEEVTEMLTGGQKKEDDIILHLCHPLCSCDRCEQLIARSRNDETLVTVFSRDDRGCTALHMAGQAGHTGMAEMLIGQGAVVDATDYHGYSPLHCACLKGHQSATLLLLHYKADVNLQDNDGHTPLHLAASNGHEECVKALVYYDQGASCLDMNVGDDFGNTPLHLAAKWGYVNIVEILLDNGAVVNVKNRKKLTPYHYAHNVKVASLIRRAEETCGIPRPKPLLFNQIPPSLQTNTVIKPTTNKQILEQDANDQKKHSNQYKKIEKLLKTVADGDIEMVKFHMGWSTLSDEDEEDGMDVTSQKLCHPLCQCDKCKPLQRVQTPSVDGITVNSANHDGFTPLHVAALHGRDYLVELFLKRGALVNAKNSTLQCTSLHFACQYNRKMVVKTLLQYGARVNARDARGNSPLHFCSFNGAKSSAEILVQNGADVNQPNHKGNTPLHEAARRNYTDLVKLLLASGADGGYKNRQQLIPAQLAQSSVVARILESSNRRPSLSTHSSNITEKPSSSSSSSPSSSSSSSSSSSTVSSSTSSSSEILDLSQPLEQSRVVIKNGSVHYLFAAFEEKNLPQLRQLGQSIQDFDKKQNLRPTVTRDRSNPRLDHLLKHQFSIQNFDSSRLRQTETCDKSQPARCFIYQQPDSEDEVCNALEKISIESSSDDDNSQQDKTASNFSEAA